MGPGKESKWAAHLDVGFGGGSSSKAHLGDVCVQLCGDDGHTKGDLCGWWFDWAHLGLKGAG